MISCVPVHGHVDVETSSIVLEAGVRVGNKLRTWQEDQSEGCGSCRFYLGVDLVECSGARSYHVCRGSKRVRSLCASGKEGHPTENELEREHIAAIGEARHPYHCRGDS